MERIRVTYPIYNLLKEFAELGIETKKIMIEDEYYESTLFPHSKKHNLLVGGEQSELEKKLQVDKPILVIPKEGKTIAHILQRNNYLRMKDYNEYTMPTISIDSSAFKKWEAVYNEVILKKSLINSDTYIMAKRIVDFYYGKNSQNNLIHLFGWKDESRVKEWVALNKKFNVKKLNNLNASSIVNSNLELCHGAGKVH